MCSAGIDVRYERALRVETRGRRHHRCGIINLGSASIRNVFLGVLLAGSIAAMYFAGVNFLWILLLCGVLNLVKEKGWTRPKQATTLFQFAAVVALVTLTESRLVQIAWLFFKTGY